MRPPLTREQKDRRNAYWRTWRKEHPDWVRAYKAKIDRRKYRTYFLKQHYGITADDYDAMLLKQKGRCAVCGGLPKRSKLVVDHDHETGKVRGLVHHGCNHVLWAFDDNFLFWKFFKYSGRSMEMARRSKFGVILDWFRTAEVDEVRAIMPLVLEACGRRHILISAPAVQRKQRRLNGPDVISKDNSRAATAAGDNG